MTLAKRLLGNTGLLVSALGYGGAPIGFTDPSRQHDFTSLVHEALDAGINFFDTAANYRTSEELLGAALRDHRHAVVLATKCGRTQKQHGAIWEDGEDWSQQGVLSSVETSLRHLRTDYLDLIQLHSPPHRVLDEGEALRGLQRAQQAGKVRFIGVSADGLEAWHAIQLNVFSTLQISYSILEQEPGDDLLPAAHNLGMGVIVKQPIANAIPARAERPPHPDWWRKWEIARRMDWEALGASGDGDNGEGRMCLALRWVLSNPAVSTAIVGTTNQEHLQANLEAANAPPLDVRTRQRVCDAYKEAGRALESPALDSEVEH